MRTTFAGLWMSLVIALALSLGVASQTTAADANQPPYVKKDTWQDTFSTSLRALIDWEKALVPKDGRKVELTLGQWWYIGPFDNENLKGYATIYPPEKEIAFDKTYEGKQEKKCVWKKGDQLRDAEVLNICPMFELTDHAIAYFYRTITSPKDQTLLPLGVTMWARKYGASWKNGCLRIASMPRHRSIATNVGTRNCVPNAW